MPSYETANNLQGFIYSRIETSSVNTRTASSQRDIPAYLKISPPQSESKPTLSTNSFLKNRLSLDKFANISNKVSPSILLDEMKAISNHLLTMPSDQIESEWFEKNMWMLGQFTQNTQLVKNHGSEIIALADKILEKMSNAPKTQYTTKQLSLIFQACGYIADKKIKTRDSKTSLTISKEYFFRFANQTTANKKFTDMRDLSNVIWAFGKCYKIDPKSKAPHALFDTLVNQFDNNKGNMTNSDPYRVHVTSRVINGMKEYLVHNSSIIPQHFVDKIKKQLTQLTTQQANCNADPYVCIPNLLYSAAILGVMDKEATTVLIGLLKNSKPLNEFSLNMLYLIQLVFPEVDYPEWLKEQLNNGGTLSQADGYTESNFQKRIFSYVQQEYKNPAELTCEKTIKGLSIDVFLDYMGENFAIECDGYESHFNVYGHLNIATDFRDKALIKLGYHPIHITSAATNDLATAKRNVVKIINEKMAMVFKAKEEARKLEVAKKMEEQRLAAEAQLALEEAEPILEVVEIEETPVVEEPVAETSSNPENAEVVKTSPRKRRRKRSTSPKPTEANVEVIVSPSQPETKTAEPLGSSVRNTARWVAGTVISAGLLAMSWYAYAMSNSEE